MSDDQRSTEPRDDEPGAPRDELPAAEDEAYEPPPFEPRPYEVATPEPEGEPEATSSDERPASAAGSPSSTFESRPTGATAAPPGGGPGAGSGLGGPTPPPPGTPSSPPPTAPARDPNVDAIARAGLAPDVDGWLREVAGQVDPRLDRVAPGWQSREQAGVARACVFGLMLGRLANDYPHTSGDLGRVAEAHPSFATLPAGARLATLRELAQDRSRGAQWVAGLVGLQDDPSPLRDILD